MEIERKFLVNSQINEVLKGQTGKAIEQTYLSKSASLTVRVRIKGEKGFLTIKGKTSGISREEFEYEIPLNEAKQMIAQFAEKSISKERFEIRNNNHLWEVDVFHGHLEGLILAEIELQAEDEEFEIPSWIDREVSDDARYFNAVLIDTDFESLK